MPDYAPASDYPFAVNALVAVAMVYLIINGWKYTFTTRMVIGYSMCGVCMIILPFLAKLGDSAGFWSCFAVLIIFGFFSGMIQGTTFTMAG